MDEGSVGRGPDPGTEPGPAPASGESPTPRTGTRLVLAAGVLFGLVHLAYTAAVRPGAVALDFEVYYFAAETVLAGGPLYGVSPVGVDYLVYAYPPLTVLAFLPFTLLPPFVAYLAFTALNLAAGLLAARLLLAYLDRYGRGLDRVDRALVYAFCTLSVHAMPSTVFGQVNLPLALAFVAGFSWLDRAAGTDTDTGIGSDGPDPDAPDGSGGGNDGGRWASRAGVAFGLAAFVKAFPALAGVWLLRRRAWRAVAAAVATGVVGVGLGLLAFGPDTTLAYVTEALLPRAGDDAFAGGLDPGAAYVTVRRPLSVLFPGWGSLALTAGAFAVVAPVVGGLYVRLDAGTPLGRLVGAYATVAGTLVLLPSFPVYGVLLYFPVVPLLYVLEGRAYVAFLAGALLWNLSVRFDDVRTVLAALGADGVAGSLRPAFALVTPSLVGLAVMFLACWLALGRAGTTGDVA